MHKLSQAIIDGSKTTSRTSGQLFEVRGTKGPAAVLCACAIGAALLGVGHVTPEQARALADGSGSLPEPQFPWELRLEKLFDQAAAPVPRKMVEEAKLRWPEWRPLDSFPDEPAVYDLVIELNDQACVPREEIAAFLAEFGY